MRKHGSYFCIVSSFHNGVNFHTIAVFLNSKMYALRWFVSLNWELSVLQGHASCALILLNQADDNIINRANLQGQT